jgi:hypothetical protein
VLKGDTLFPLLNGCVYKIPEILMGKRSAKLMLPVKVWKFFKFDGKKTCQNYPVVNYHRYGKSPFFMGKSTINHHFQ